MTSPQSSYRQILKATSIFGGVQVFQIIITIVRTKVIAVLLGPAGMGINGLLTSTTGMVAGLTNFGLGTSAVKNVAAAHGAGDAARIGTVVGVLRRLVWITGTLGALATLVLSPWLSELTFGNRDYTLAFVLISVTLLLNQISTGQGVVLQGTRQLKYLAQAGLTGAVMGMVVSLPIYYFWGIDGIVPAIIVSSFVSLLITLYFSRKVKISKVEIDRDTLVNEGKGMLTMGFMLSLSGIITLAASYVIRIYISNTGGVEQVGLYSAGFAIINTYVGMIFTAMGTDYYPRLSAVAHDNEQCKTIINQQAEIALLILGPVIMVFLVFINWVVILLYSRQFIPVTDMIMIAALGMFFRAASWAVAFVFMAKGASKLFFLNELAANIYVLVFNILGYTLWGLTGLGVSFLAAYILYLLQVFVVARVNYGFGFAPAFLKIFLVQTILALACFVLVKLAGSPYSYFFGTGLIIISAAISYKELDKRLDLKSIFLTIKNRFGGRE